MNDGPIFTFEDVWALFLRKRNRILCFALFGALFALNLSWIRKPHFLAEAKFFEIPESKGIRDPLQEIFNVRDLISSSSQSIMLMKTNRVMKKVVERLGLSAHVSTTKFNAREMIDFLKAEFGYPIPDSDPFLFQDVVFERERSRSYFLVFDRANHFSLLDQNRSFLKAGFVGEEIVCDGKFTLIQTPKNIRLHHLYRLNIDPWTSIVKQVVKSLTILEDRKNKSLISLSFTHTDRRLAASILNELMLEYQRYLREEYDELSSMQLAYLGKKQKQILQNVSDVFDDNARYLEANLDEMGWLDFSDSLNGALFLHREMEGKVLKLEIELAQVDQLDKEDCFISSLGEGPLFLHLSKIAEKIWDLKNQRELLYQDSFDEKGVLDGIDLETARSLFLEYNAKLDVSERRLRNYRQIQESIEAPTFEISSLSSTLTDPYSQKLISEASQIGLLLKDEKHHSEKEGQRWKDELSLQKKILKTHLDQLLKVEEIHADLSREKMLELKNVGRCCIDSQITVLKNQASSLIAERRSILVQEKRILESKMGELRKRISQRLPDQWRGEKWLSFKTELEMKMMTTLTDLIESKTIGYHLHHIGSKPLDFASVPTFPERSGLFVWVFVGAVFFSLSSFFYYFLQAMRKGFSLSLSKLQALQYPVCGKITFENDLEFLRRAANFIAKEKGKVISLLIGKGPDYSFALAQNFALRSKRCVVIDCEFKESKEQGILQLWENEIEKIPLEHREGYDILLSGGFSLHGVEILQSNVFQSVLDRLKSMYDFVFMVYRSPLDSAESNQALSFCDKVIITVSDEPLEFLHSFVHWSCQGKTNGLTFAAFDYERTKKKENFSHWWSRIPWLPSVRAFAKRRARSFVRG